MAPEACVGRGDRHRAPVKRVDHPGLTTFLFTGWGAACGTRTRGVHGGRRGQRPDRPPDENEGMSDSGILVLTGPPCAGKSSVGRVLAADSSREREAYLEVDALFSLLLPRSDRSRQDRCWATTRLMRWRCISTRPFLSAPMRGKSNGPVCSRPCRLHPPVRCGSSSSSSPPTRRLSASVDGARVRTSMMLRCGNGRELSLLG